MIEAAQVEVLILERVREFMRHDRLLSIEIDPVGEMKLLRLRIVIAGDLFGQQTNHQRTILKFSGRQAKFSQGYFRRVGLRGRHIFIEILDERAFDLRARLRRTFHRTEDRELQDFACLFEHVNGRRDKSSVAGGRSRRGRLLWRTLRRTCEAQRYEEYSQKAEENRHKARRMQPPRLLKSERAN